MSFITSNKNIILTTLAAIAIAAHLFYLHRIAVQFTPTAALQAQVASQGATLQQIVSLINQAAEQAPGIPY